MKLPQSVAAAAMAACLSVSPMPHIHGFAQSVQAAGLQAAEMQDSGLETSPFLEELKRRTEANKEINAAAVEAVTRSNTFTAIEGIVPRNKYQNQGGNCVFEKCSADARAALMSKFEPVDPMDTMRSEYARVKQGLDEKFEEVAAVLPLD